MKSDETFSGIKNDEVWEASKDKKIIFCSGKQLKVKIQHENANFAQTLTYLKANQNFLQLQDQLEKIENDVRNSRRTFNEAINTYNTKVRSFPMNLLAGMFGFKAKEGFKADEGAEKAPKVQF